MPQVEINYLAVLVAAVATMVVGGLWYGPVFGKPWMRMMGWDPNNQEQMAKMKKDAPKGYVGGLVTAFISALVLAILLEFTNTLNVSSALLLGLLVWLGFTATVQFGSVLWENKSVKLFFLNTVYNLVVTLIVAAILVSWV